MKAFRLLLLAFALGGSALVVNAQTDQPSKPTLNIEAAMRAWQERWVVLTGADQIFGISNPNGYKMIVWPARSTDLRTPGPYPVDCFYAEEMQDPKKAALLVSKFIAAMSTSMGQAGAPGGFGVIRRFDPLWPQWSQPFPNGPTTSSSTDGLFRWMDASGSWVRRDITQAPWSSDFGSVTLSNYEAKFQTIVNHWLNNPCRVLWRFSPADGTDYNWTHRVARSDYADCLSCIACRTGQCAGGGCVADLGKAGDHALNVVISLGKGSQGDIGSLQIYAKTPSLDLATPYRLAVRLNARVHNSSAGGGIVDSEGYSIYDESTFISKGYPLLRQVVLPQGLVDIVTETGEPSYSYTLYFYDNAHKGSKVGRFFAPNITDAYQWVKISNPGRQPTDYNRLKVDEMTGRTYTYTYTPPTNPIPGDVTGSWSKSDNAGSIENVSIAWTTGSGAAAGDIRQEVYTITDPFGVSALKTQTKHKIFPWNIDPATTKPYVGRGRREELIEDVSDPDPLGKQITTTYRYYDDVVTTSPNYSRLKQRESADGSWSRYEYDSQGRVTRTYTALLDSAAPAAAAGPVAGDYRLTEITYGTTPSQTVVETLVRGGVSTVVSRSFTDIDESSPTFAVSKDVRAVSPSAAYTDPTNLVTTTRTLKTGAFIGSPDRVIYPDGTVTLYTYSYVTGGNTTVVEARGVPNNAVPLSATDIVAGTRTTRVTNPQGQEVSLSVVDAASGIRTSNITYFNFDAFGRWQSALRGPGQIETRSFDCCGLVDTTDSTGLRTHYIYNTDRNLYQETRYLAISGTPISELRYTYDAAGRRLTTTRYSVGPSADLTTPTAILLETSQYNLAGQRIASTTPDGQTLFSETTTGGRRVSTTTFADGGTQIQTFRSDGSLASVTGTAVAPVNYDEGTDVGGRFTQTTKVGEAGALTEWTKEYADFAGRPIRTVLADGATVTRTYNAKGQLASVTLPPDNGAVGVTTLYLYNALGQVETTAVDLNQNGVVDFNGTDRIAKSVQDVAETVHANATYQVVRSTTSIWPDNNLDTPRVVSASEAATDGLHAWTTQNGITAENVTLLGTDGAKTITTTSPDGAQTVQNYSGGRLISSVSAAGGVTLSRVDLAYDGHGRMEASTDARTGTTRYKYFNNDRIKSVTTPDPDLVAAGPGYDAQVTQFTYDNMGRQATQTLADGGVVNFRYWPTGQLKRTWGTRTYAQQTTYDPQGRLKTLATWRGFYDEINFESGVGRSVTTWNYHPQRGWLDNKRYNDNTGPAYLYYPSGQLKQRAWARGITATYLYNNAGELSNVNYSDGTPAVALTYDRLGRTTQVTDAAGSLVTTFQGDTALPTAETYGAGLLNGSVVGRSYDSLYRLNLLSLPGVAYTLGFSYRDGSRLDSVSSLVAGVTLAHTYTYHANSGLIDTLTQKRGATTMLSTTRTYDQLNRLSAIVAMPSVGPNVSTAYGFNNANQRVTATEADGKYWAYGYDALGQVTSGKKKLPDGTALAGHDLNYLFDTIGNRTTSTANGAPTTYALDATGLNQYQTRTVPTQVDITGSADAAATVTVNLVPAERQAELFHSLLSVNNSANPVWQPVTIVAAKAGAGPGGTDAIQRQTGNVFIPKTPEVFGYDADGNLLSDGKWIYTWDGENRLIAMETQPAAVTAGAPRQKLNFTYDAQSRRIQKKVSSWNGSAYVAVSDTRFLYDGWNLLAELNALASNVVTRTYVWGLDLSGSAQGAGGVGGLLALNSGGATYAPTYDGNGNVISLINLQDGTTAAEYAYGPFGEVIRATGLAVTRNPFGFSTKYLDQENGLNYYGYRYYHSGVGRWASRDPIDEFGGANIYGFVDNDALNNTDTLGLLLAAFDGTGNDARDDEWDDNPGTKKNAPTNVEIMRALYDGSVIYRNGVGTRTDIILGDLAGKGTGERIDTMIKAVADHFKEFGCEPIDVIGFSRGAASAREFANRLKTKVASANIRFLGLFDTVSQMGLPNSLNYQFGFDLDVDATAIGYIAHAVAADEHRKLFPLTSISKVYTTLPGMAKKYKGGQINEIIGSNYWEKPFAGVHSDIGGGYQDGRNVDALIWMIERGQAAGAPFQDLSKYMFRDSVKWNKKPHDSRYPVIDRVPWTHWGRSKRTIFPGNL